MCYTRIYHSHIPTHLSHAQPDTNTYIMRAKRGVDGFARKPITLTTLMMCMRIPLYVCVCLLMRHMCVTRVDVLHVFHVLHVLHVLYLSHLLHLLHLLHLHSTRGCVECVTCVTSVTCVTCVTCVTFVLNSWMCHTGPSIHHSFSIQIIHACVYVNSIRAHALLDA